MTLFERIIAANPRVVFGPTVYDPPVGVCHEILSWGDAAGVWFVLFRNDVGGVRQCVYLVRHEGPRACSWPFDPADEERLSRTLRGYGINPPRLSPPPPSPGS